MQISAEGRQWDVKEPRHRPRAVQWPHLTPEQRRVKKWINEVRRNVKSSHPRFHPASQPTIFLPPTNISHTDRAAYEPSIVSIGPLHRGRGELQDFKLRFVRCLLSRCGNGNDASRILDECLMDLKARDAEVRGCYSRNFSHIDPYKLATVMLLDGCFIIYLMLRRQEEGDTVSVTSEPPNLAGESIAEIVDNMVQESKKKGNKKEEGMSSCVPEVDLEAVLGSGLESEAVVDLEIGGTEENFGGLLLGTDLEGSTEQGTVPKLTGESIVEVVDKAQEIGTKEQEKQEGMSSCVPEVDLESVLGSGSESGSESESVVDLEIGGAENFDGLLLGNLWTWNLIVYDLLKVGNQIPFFAIRLIFDKFFKTPSNDPGDGDQLTDLALNLFSDIHPNKSVRFRMTCPDKIHHLLHLFHSSIVTDWEASQPKAVAVMHGASTTPERIPNATDLEMAGVRFKRKEKFDSFLDVSFNENGILEIPPLRIYDYSKSLFRNLIAFEQCYPDTNADITIYANFMDSIIDTGNDARLLHMKGILYNGLSTNDEVASLFNQLCNQIHLDPRKNYLNDLFVKVTKYHESKWHQWRAGLVRDYFNNPWAIISMIAAVLLLLLTIEQCFFAAFSYFRPP